MSNKDPSVIVDDQVNQGDDSTLCVIYANITINISQILTKKSKG